MPMIPETIGHYRITREVGRGGMATVYLAQDTRFNRQVVIKVLPRQFTHDPKFRARFAREAQTIARLEHPSIVPIYDSGEEGDQPYLVMRHMPGGTLASRLAQGPMDVPEAAAILKSVAAALDYAHQQGIVHRDVKPSNILFDQNGAAYLSDFGIVQLAEATRSFTGSAVVGTPAYMSPEQVQGGRKIDGRSDVYALGIVLYEMLSGEVPYNGETPTQKMMKHVLEPVPRISRVKPDIPPAVDGVLMRALAKKPKDRFPTATAFVAALGGPGSSPQFTVYPLPAAETPPPTSDYSNDYEPLPAPQRRRRVPLAWTAGIGAAVLALLCLTGALVMLLVGGLPGSFPSIEATSPGAIAVVAEPATETRESEASAVALPLATDTPTPLPTVTQIPPFLTLTPTLTPTPSPDTTGTAQVIATTTANAQATLDAAAAAQAAAATATAQQNGANATATAQALETQVAINAAATANAESDADGDGLTYNEEIALGSDPARPDTDGDGLRDGEERNLGTNLKNPDSDGDGLSDGDEVTNKGTNPTSVDTDNDGLTDGQEVSRGTDPANSDTDGDGLGDGDEINRGTNPTNPDSDRDGLSDRDEVSRGTNPINSDTDGDGFNDKEDPNPTQAATLIPLQLYWYGKRTDNVTVATARGIQEQVASGYQFVRTEGYIFRDKRPGTIPLQLYWYGKRADNVTVATARGIQEQVASGYQFVRTEGYIYPSKKVLLTTTIYPSK